MSTFEEYQKLITSLPGQIFTKEIDLMVERPNHITVRYHSNGYRTIHGIFKDGILENYNYKDGIEDVRDMAPLRNGPAG